MNEPINFNQQQQVSEATELKCPALARVLSVSGDLHSLNDRYNVNESVADDFS
ncbi:MAG: hypothetical protein M3413_02760 [Bacteroidota bacterium]|nr:hypothetical protein [Bacteroidota bacterium]